MIRIPDLIRKAARKAGLTARRGIGPDPASYLDHDRMVAAMDRQIEKHMQEMDEAMQRFEDDFMEPYLAFERDKYGSSASLVGEGGQLQLDITTDPDQRDLFAEVGR